MKWYYSSNPEVVGERERNAYDLERKKNVWCKRRTIVGWEVTDCYKELVLRFRVEGD